uniref:Uncharacterized protein n=1 Tax=Pseudictyota dubia TaxID=2749911 RepID=A0A7R9ZA82_9STRA|mmetsp:Transcript_33180/g.61115  ORF Transcript_33180/g.61115 Transcript_33180/m.61115 type:complete len:250 (+) Transcript_33180:137-886(+)
MEFNLAMEIALSVIFSEGMLYRRECPPAAVCCGLWCEVWNAHRDRMPPRSLLDLNGVCIEILPLDVVSSGDVAPRAGRYQNLPEWTRRIDGGPDVLQSIDFLGRVYTGVRPVPSSTVGKDGSKAPLTGMAIESGPHLVQPRLLRRPRLRDFTAARVRVWDVPRLKQRRPIIDGDEVGNLEDNEDDDEPPCLEITLGERSGRSGRLVPLRGGEGRQWECGAMWSCRLRRDFTLSQCTGGWESCDGRPLWP